MGIFNKTKQQTSHREEMLEMFVELHDKHPQYDEQTEWELISGKTAESFKLYAARAVSSYALVARGVMIIKDELTEDEFNEVLAFTGQLQFTFKLCAMRLFHIKEERSIGATDEFFETILNSVLDFADSASYDEMNSLEHCYGILFDAVDKAIEVELSATSGIDNVVSINKDLH